MKRSFLAASMLLLAFPSLPANSLTLTGVGSQSCQSWQEASRTKATEASANWVFGYLDGLSISVNGNNAVKGLPQADLLSHLDKQSIIKLMSVYCDGHPARTLQQAVTQIGAQLIAEDRSRSKPGPSVASAVQVRQPRTRAETTGSGDITGSLRSAGTPGCKVVDVADSQGQTVHQLRKCD